MRLVLLFLSISLSFSFHARQHASCWRRTTCRSLIRQLTAATHEPAPPSRPVVSRSKTGLAAASTGTATTAQKVEWLAISMENDQPAFLRDITDTDEVCWGDEIQEGQAVFVLNNVASQEECERLCRLCTQAADEHRRGHANKELDKPGLVRLPTIAAAERAAQVNLPCPKPIPEEAERMCTEFMNRVFRVVDEELPSSVVGKLFAGQTSLVDMYQFSSSADFSTEMERDDPLALDWSSREPAINVYTEGGEFHTHLDAQALTILMTLSVPDTDFQGGGTAFWGRKKVEKETTEGGSGDKNNNPPPGNSPPTLVSRPPPGTVMLFGGSLYHAGIPVQSGERLVFVASFSPRSSRAERKQLYAQDSEAVF